MKRLCCALLVVLAACSPSAPPPADSGTPHVVELGAAHATLHFVDIVGYDVASTPARLARFELTNDTKQPWLLYGTQRAEGLVVAGPFARIEQRDDEAEAWFTPFGDDAAAPLPPDSITLGPGGHERIAVELPAAMFAADLRDVRWRVCLALDAAAEACSEQFTTTQ
jgi:hypothetical protein